MIMGTRFVDSMFPVFMLRLIASSVFIIVPDVMASGPVIKVRVGPKSIGKKGLGFYGKGDPLLNPGSKQFRKRGAMGGRSSPRLNILVVRINASDELTSSQPCCMCSHMMQAYGIYRIYYSNEKGEICYEKVDDLAPSNVEDYVSKGLTTMIIGCSETIKSARLPLTKKQKTHIIRKYLKNEA
jgi:hypothetical protein